MLPHNDIDNCSLFHNKDEVVFVQSAFIERINPIFAQGTDKVNKLWVLIDSQSTVDLFYNPDLLRDITKVKDHITVHCNAGTFIKVTDMCRWPFTEKNVANFVSHSDY